MNALQERLFILDNKYRRERNAVENKKLLVYYGRVKTNKIRKKEAISVIFENDKMREERTLKAIARCQDTVYVRPQTDDEKLDAKFSNRMFTEYSVFMDDKRVKGSLEAALRINSGADRKNVSEKVRKEIETKLRNAYLSEHRGYKEPIRQLELFD